MTFANTVVLGGRGLVGSAIVGAAQEMGEKVLSPSSSELDLRNRAAVGDFFERHRPRRVYLAAAIVGGILENSRNPVPFVNDNVLMQTHVLESAYRTGVERLMLLGSSCIYPRACTQPMRETDLMTGPLEPTNSAYAMAKLVGLEQIAAYNRQYGTRWLYVIPPNVYGPRDHFFSDKSHVISALLTHSPRSETRGDARSRSMGNGFCALGIHLRRGSCPNARPTHEHAGCTDANKHRNGVRRFDPGTCGDHRRSHRLPRHSRMGHDQAGRHAA